MFWIGLGIIIILPFLVHYLKAARLIGACLNLKIPAQNCGRVSIWCWNGAGARNVGGVACAYHFIPLPLLPRLCELVFLAVSRGQTEAAYALGVRPKYYLAARVIPQAMRVIIPPLTSQYLNLQRTLRWRLLLHTPSLVSVFAGTALTRLVKKIEMIFMMMMVYLTFSLMTAAFMNWFNSRVKLVER